MIEAPIAMSAPHTPGVIYLSFVAFFFVGTGLFAVHRLVVRKDPLMLICMAAGLIASFIEPVLDVVSLVWYPSDSLFITIETFGRHIPLYVVLGYSLYFGGFTYLIYEALLKGAGAKLLWWVYVGDIISDIVFETPGLLMGVYTYYGNQPFNYWGMPLWYPFLNSGQPVLMAVIMYAMRDQLKGWGMLWAIPMVGMTYGAMNGAVGWPVWNGLNSTASTLVVHLCGLITIALSFLVVYVTIKVHARLANQQPEEMVIPGKAVGATH